MTTAVNSFLTRITSFVILLYNGSPSLRFAHHLFSSSLNFLSFSLSFVSIQSSQCTVHLIPACCCISTRFLHCTWSSCPLPVTIRGAFILSAHNPTSHSVQTNNESLLCSMIPQWLPIRIHYHLCPVYERTLILYRSLDTVPALFYLSILPTALLQQLHFFFTLNQVHTYTVHKSTHIAQTRTNSQQFQQPLFSIPNRPSTGFIIQRY